MNTSKEAFEVVKPKINKLHKQLLDCLKQQGIMTASELMETTGVLYNTTWRRLSELKDMGLVVNTEHRRKNSRGRWETLVALAKD